MHHALDGGPAIQGRSVQPISGARGFLDVATTPGDDVETRDQIIRIAAQSIRRTRRTLLFQSTVFIVAVSFLVLEFAGWFRA